MKLVAGLGNPGKRYQKNRHNIGFAVLDQLALVNRIGSWNSKFDGLVTDCTIADEKVLLSKPMTYMNRSGRAVRDVVSFYKLTLDNLLVVCDDFNLPLGKLRLRQRGSSGGQRGLEDIFNQIGTNEICRLRVGVGSPIKGGAVDFVLSDFSRDEMEIVQDMVIDAARAVECWCRSGIEAAMNEFNGRDRVKE